MPRHTKFRVRTKDTPRSQPAPCLGMTRLAFQCAVYHPPHRSVSRWQKDVFIADQKSNSVLIHGKLSVGKTGNKRCTYRTPAVVLPVQRLFFLFGIYFASCIAVAAVPCVPSFFVAQSSDCVKTKNIKKHIFPKI